MVIALVIETLEIIVALGNLWQLFWLVLWIENLQWEKDEWRLNEWMNEVPKWRYLLNNCLVNYSLSFFHTFVCYSFIILIRIVNAGVHSKVYYFIVTFTLFHVLCVSVRKLMSQIQCNVEWWLQELSLQSPILYSIMTESAMYFTCSADRLILYFEQGRNVCHTENAP